MHILEPNLLSAKASERFETLKLYTDQLLQLLNDSISSFPVNISFKDIFSGVESIPDKLLTTYEHTYIFL